MIVIQGSRGFATHEQTDVVVTEKLVVPPFGPNLKVDGDGVN
jgi:hypothetical protein